MQDIVEPQTAVQSQDMPRDTRLVTRGRATHTRKTDRTDGSYKLTGLSIRYNRVSSFSDASSEGIPSAARTLGTGQAPQHPQHGCHNPCAFVWLHKLRLYEHRLLDNTALVQSRTHRCTVPEHADPLLDLIAGSLFQRCKIPAMSSSRSCSHGIIGSIGRQRTSFETAQSIP